MSEHETTLTDDEIRRASRPRRPAAIRPEEGDSDGRRTRTAAATDSDGRRTRDDSDDTDSDRRRRQRQLGRASPSRAASRRSTPSAFLDDYWERKPLLVARDEAGRFDELLTDRGGRAAAHGRRHALPGLPAREGGRDDPARRLHGGHPLAAAPVHGHGRRRAASLAEFDDGATIVLQALHISTRRSPRSAASSSSSSAIRCRRTRTTRRASAQGFRCTTTRTTSLPPGRGEKRWLVYEPVLELPLKHQRYSAELGEPGSRVLDVTLRAGDTLYLPRGWLHEALTSDTTRCTSPSGSTSPRGATPCATALDEVAEEDVALRRGVDGRRTRRTGCSRRSPSGSRRTRRAAPSAGSFVEGARGRSAPTRFDQLRALEDLDSRRRSSAARPSSPTSTSPTATRGSPSTAATLSFPARSRRARVRARGGRRRSPPPSCPGASTTRAASCSCAAPRARRACSGSRRTDDVAPRALDRLPSTGQQGRSPGSSSTAHRARLARRRRTRPSRRRRPRSTRSSARSSMPRRPVALADEALGRLHGERVERAPAVVAHADPPCEVLVEHRPGRLAVDASVVEALRQADEVAGEAVAADVRALPDPVGLDLVAQRLVERPPVPRAARVVLAVGADEEERMARRARRRARSSPRRSSYASNSVRGDRRRARPATPPRTRRAPACLCGRGAG